MKAERPEAIPLAGGTDVMVDMNFGRLRPPAIIDVSRLGELTSHREDNGKVYLGSGVTYATIVREMAAFKPLVQASRSVGSPQIRNRGTVGGNLGTASPADAGTSPASSWPISRSKNLLSWSPPPPARSTACAALQTTGDTAARSWPGGRSAGHSASGGCRRGCEDESQWRVARSRGLARHQPARLAARWPESLRLRERGGGRRGRVGVRLGPWGAGPLLDSKS